jgi:dipeptidyl aminopeptidase/acylaminoacyl peptidase
MRRHIRKERSHTMKRYSSIIFGLLVSLWFPFATHAQSPTRLMAPGDILRVANVGDAQISPDSERVVYTVTTVDGNAGVTTLWITRTGGEVPVGPPTSRQPEQRRENPPRRSSGALLLPPTWNASNPRWSPDGKRIAFLATHDNQRGIWVVSLEGRQPRFVAEVQATNFFITYAGESFAWSPDSRSLAFISATRESPNQEGGDSRDDPRVIDRLQYKSRTSFSDNLRTHVWMVDVDDPQPRQLTSGPFYDHALTFSPRGDEVAFLSNRESDPDANNNSDIFAVDLHGQVRQITNTDGCEYEPAWSPDGKRIAYAATKREVTTIDSVAEDTHVWVIDAVGGAGRDLTALLDRRARSPRWKFDSQSILFLAGNHGCTTLFRVALYGGESRQFLPEILRDDRLTPWIGPGLKPAANRYQVGGFSVAQRRESRSPTVGQAALEDWQVACTLSAPSLPGEIWLTEMTLFARRLTGHNDGVFRAPAFVEPDEISFKSFDGTSIQGWLMKPAGWRSDRKYPLILSIHGGPHGMYGYGFNPTFQVYAARGYAVLYLNPRGSSGYGQRFSDGTLNEWGGGDYRDLMVGVDEALKRYPWIDGDRLGVTGGSYGGFMTNWIITQTPRFKAAVSVASVSNLISFYSTSLYQDLIHAEFGGFPWDNYDLLWQWSPLRYVKQAQTPTLFIHGEQDNDVHITQAEEMYMGLKRRGVDTVFVRYPREGHGLREPRHRVDALERTLAWFDRYLK